MLPSPIGPNSSNSAAKYPIKEGKQEEVDELTAEESAAQVAKDKLSLLKHSLKHSQIKSRNWGALIGAPDPLGEQKKKDLSSSSGKDEFDDGILGEFEFTLDSETPPLVEMKKGEKKEAEKGKEASTNNDKVKETAQKTEKASSTWFGAAGNALSYVTSTAAQPFAWGIKKGVLSYAHSYQSSMDTEKKIEAAKKEMLDSLKDSQLIEFFDFIETFIIQAAQNKPQETPPEGFIADILADQGSQTLILDLIKINLAKGFANLAKEVVKNKDNIPNFANQPSLVNILSLISQKTSSHFNKQVLIKIEEKYHQDKAELSRLISKLFGDIDNEHSSDKTKKTKKELIQEYIHTSDSKQKKAIIAQLFPRLKEENQRKADIQSFISTLEKLNQRNQEIHQLFSVVADDILVCFFPKRFADLEIPSFLKGNFGEWLYNRYAKDLIVTLLHQTYEPLESDPNLIKKWETDLQKRVGVDFDSLTKAPAALLGALLKDYIKADPQVVESVADFLDSTKNPERPAKPDELQKCQQIIAQLSQHQLANWLVESLQAMLHTEDAHLLGLGDFTQQVLHKLTFALLAKCAAQVIPADEKVDKTQFIKILTDRLVEKFHSFQAEQVTEDLKDFVQDLPLPSQVKDLILSTAAKKAASFQSLMPKEASEDLKKSQTAFESESEKTLKGYEFGPVLLSVIKKISDQIVEQALEQNIGLVSTLGMGDTIEELLVEYLPGVKINEDLKTWFKENVSALGATEAGKSPESIVRLKKQFEAVLRSAVVATIKTNFKNDSRAFAAKLLENIENAFSLAFGFKPLESDASSQEARETQRRQLEQINEIQRKIQTTAQSIKEAKEKIPPKPILIKDKDQTSVPVGAVQETQSEEVKAPSVSEEELTLLEENVHAKMRYIRASNYIDDLIKKRDQVLVQLNRGLSDQQQWTVAQLAQVHPLSSFTGMSSDQLQLIKEATNLESTIQHARQELHHLYLELNQKSEAVRRYDELKGGDRADWEQALLWLYETLNNDQIINQLYLRISALEEELQTQLSSFKALSEELMSVMGLGQKTQKEIVPTFLQGTILPFIQSMHKHIARLLSEQMTPFMLSIFNIEKNRERLTQLSSGDRFLAQLSKSAAAEVMNRVSEYVTSYQPLVKQLWSLFGVDDPLQDQISSVDLHLRNKMITLGKEGTTASMLLPLIKGFVPEEEEKHLTEALAQLIVSGAGNISKEQCTTLLSKNSIPTDRKERKKLEANAEKLAYSANQFLLYRGKPKLEPQHVVEVFQPFMALNPQQTTKAAEDIKASKILDKIKSVVISPEEIVAVLNDILPGASELKGLLAPQIQELLAGKDKALEKNRKLIESYVEAMLLQIFVKMAETNKIEHRTVFEVLTKRLERLAVKAKEIEGKTHEEVAREMIDGILEALGLKSELDLAGMPPLLQRLAYEKIKEQAYEQLTPMMIPIIKRNRMRGELDRISGSSYLSSVAKSLCNTIFFLLPYGIKSYQVIAKEMFVLLAEKQPTKDEDHIIIDLLAKEINTLVMNSKQKNVTHHALVDAYSRVANVKLSATQRKECINKLNQRKVKDEIYKVKEEIQAIIKSPENIADLIGAELPAFDSKMRSAFAAELQEIVHDRPDVYQNISGFATTYIEGMLLNLFIQIAQKNPPQAGKNTIVLLTEKVLSLITEQYQNLRKIETALRLTMIRLGKIDLNPDLLQSVSAGLPREKAAVIVQSLIEATTKDDFKEFSKENVYPIFVREFPPANKREEQQLAEKANDLAKQVNLSLMNRGKAKLTPQEILNTYQGLEVNPLPNQRNETLLAQFGIIVDKAKSLELKEISRLLFTNFSEELNNAIMKDVLGIESAAVFVGLPPSQQTTVYESLKSYIKEMLLSFRSSMEMLEGESTEVLQAKQRAKQFGVEAQVAKSYAEILSNDLANLIIETIPGFLTEKALPAGQMRGVNVISKGMGTYLEYLSRGNVEIAQLLLEDTETAEKLQSTLADKIEEVADVRNLVNEKQKAAELISNFILVPLTRLLEQTRAYEEHKGVARGKKLMSVILRGIGHHVKNLNAARQSGHATMLHADYIKAAQGLHPAVPVAAVKYQETINVVTRRIGVAMTAEQKRAWEEGLFNAFAAMNSEENKGAKVIKLEDVVKEIGTLYATVAGTPLTEEQRNDLMLPDEKGLTLKELIRKEGEAHNVQRQTEFYIPTTNEALNILYPNGKRDLSYVPEEYRGTIWKQLKKNFPTILPMIVEAILSPDTLDQIVLKQLEKTRDSLKGDIVLSDPVVRPVDELDEAAGAMIEEVLKMIELPSILKNQLVGADGKVSDAMKQSLGTTLHEILSNGKFMQNLLNGAIESNAQRDAEGNYALKVTAPLSEAERQAKRLKVREDIKRVSREVADEGTSYGVRYTWAKMQKSLDKIIEKVFGRVGKKLKEVLDVVFATLFFKIIGTILSVVLYPLKKLLHAAIYKIVSLDKNRDKILGLYQNVPKDQPLTSGHVAYNEDLVFNTLGEVIKFFHESVKPDESQMEIA